MPEILLIQPTQITRSGEICRQNRLYLPSLSHPSLAALAPKHWKVRIQCEVIEEIDYNTDADIIGIGSMGYAALHGLEIAREFKKRGKTVIMGGYMVSLAHEYASQYVDSITIGDGEISFPQVLKDFENGELKPIYRNPVDNLDNLPIPRYDLLMEKPIGSMLPVQAGRGCPHSCSFCSIACLYHQRYMVRPIPEIIRDISAIRDLGMKEFYMIDDNIIGNPGFFEELCLAIKPLKMRWSSQCSIQIAKNEKLLKLAADAGVSMLSFGLESITQEGIDRLGKPWLRVEEHQKLIDLINKAGILVSSEMIAGTDSDTVKSLEETADFVNNARIAIPRFYILTPIPSTPLYNEFKENNRLLTEDIAEYDGTKPVYKPANMESEELEEAYWKLSNKVFSIGSIIRRTLLHPNSRKQPFLYIFAFFVNLHYRRYIKRRIPPNIF